MKTHKNLFSKIATFENLLIAAKKAQRGKRFEPEVSAFNFQLEANLFQLRDELLNETYQPGPYTEFKILEPKPRTISAAPYRDRVVHHALCNLVGPILENSMIEDTYANRKEKGTHRAIIKYQQLSCQYKYVLKCDIKKFFPSIDHEKLKELLRRKIACKATLRLIDKIINNSNPQEEHLAYFPQDDLFSPYQRRRGLPIGNLTSQLFGNYYLSPLDHFIKEQLHCRAYLRYVDDFVILGQCKSELAAIKSKIAIFLQAYRLLLHEHKSRIHPTKEGVTFLGHRVFHRFRLLPSSNIRRFRKRLKRNLKEYFEGKISKLDFNRSVRAWFAHAAFSNTYRLREKIFMHIYRP